MSEPLTDIEADYENGLQCSWLGRSTHEMTYRELIAFIGQLDSWVTHLLSLVPSGALE